MKNKIYFLAILFAACVSYSCSSEEAPIDPEVPEQPEVNPNEVIYDETGCLYTSYKKLVMCGYQGWFATEDDGLGRGWYHYVRDGKLEPGYVCIDVWPDMTEYEKQYAAPGFFFEDGSQAYLYSNQDESTIDLHFRWMKEYGIDGVFMQRFVSQTKDIGKVQFNKVLGYALKAAKKYDRAICIMYDGHIGNQDDYEAITSDWNELVETFKLFDPQENPTFLRHNGKPVFSLWGVGFTDRRFDAEWFDKLCEEIKGTEKKKTTLLFGMPYSWREMGDDCTKDEQFQPMIQKWCDIILPWAVGRYRTNNVAERVKTSVIADMAWCKENKKDYVPVAFPGFSWGNLNPGTPYDDIPREGGEFLWKQVAAAKAGGAEMLYIAMFDEMDEATCIFKCLPENQTPLNGTGKFIGYEEGLGSDYYLWLAGQATNWYHGESGYTERMPVRNK